MTIIFIGSQHEIFLFYIRNILLFTLISFNVFFAFGQNQKTGGGLENIIKYRTKNVQFSLLPGVSTNGLESGQFFNKISFNLTTGFSAGNQLFEIGSIANIHTRYSTGIQLAGLANVVGSNSYLNMDRNRLVDKDFVKGFSGIQFSGILNFSRSEVTGFQFTGGFNTNLKNAHALQIAGIGNSVGIGAYGFQIAGIYNFTRTQLLGAQVSLLYNYAGNEFSGIQLGTINKTKLIRSFRSVKKSSQDEYGIQIGILNIAKEMDGLQIGLINYTKSFRGIQIGIVNFHKRGPYPGSSGKYGVPIGLLNFGSFAKRQKVFLDNLFLTGVALSSSNCTNCSWTKSTMPFKDSFQKVIENELIFQYNPIKGFNNRYLWSIGYGLHHLFYKKSSLIAADPGNRKFFLSYGIRLMHATLTEKLDEESNFISKVMLRYGYRILGRHLVIGFSFDSIFYEQEKPEELFELATGRLGKSNYQLNLGYSIEIQI